MYVTPNLLNNFVCNVLFLMNSCTLGLCRWNAVWSTCKEAMQTHWRFLPGTILKLYSIFDLQANQNCWMTFFSFFPLIGQCYLFNKWPCSSSCTVKRYCDRSSSNKSDIGFWKEQLAEMFSFDHGALQCLKQNSISFFLICMCCLGFEKKLI